MRRLIRGFARAEHAATMVEYGLVVAVIALVVGAGAGALGRDVSTIFAGIGAALLAIPLPG